jgi:hypothetical protein
VYTSEMSEDYFISAVYIYWLAASADVKGIDFFSCLAGLRQKALMLMHLTVATVKCMQLLT